MNNFGISHGGVARLLGTALGITVLLASCGGGGGSDDNAQNTAQGTFLDSAVEGLSYVSGELSGTTNAQGVFEYKTGQMVTFSVGGIILGSSQGAAILTPLELAPDAVDETDRSVVNILRFLQTIDNDGDPSNGIQITQLMRDLAVNASINFNMNIDDFTNNGGVQTLISELTSVSETGARILVGEATALVHFQGTLANLNGTSTTSGSLIVSGNDAPEFGGQLTLTDFSFAPETGGTSEFLMAINSPTIIINSFKDGGENGSGISGISMRIHNENGAWLYSGTFCVSPLEPSCDRLVFDVPKRTLTFNNAVVEPSIDDDNANSQSTAPLTLNGTLAWSNSDVDRELALGDFVSDDDSGDNVPEDVGNSNTPAPDDVPNTGTCSTDPTLPTTLTSSSPSCSGSLVDIFSDYSVQFTTGNNSVNFTGTLSLNNGASEAFYEFYDSYSNFEIARNFVTDCWVYKTGGESCSVTLAPNTTYYIGVSYWDIATDFTITVSAW